MIENVIAWKDRHLTQRQMTSILAFIIGILASVAAYVLHGIITLIQKLLTEDFLTDAATRPVLLPENQDKLTPLPSQPTPGPSAAPA